MLVWLVVCLMPLASYNSWICFCLVAGYFLYFCDGTTDSSIILIFILYARYFFLLFVCVAYHAWYFLRNLPLFGAYFFLFFLFVCLFCCFDLLCFPSQLHKTLFTSIHIPIKIVRTCLYLLSTGSSSLRRKISVRNLVLLDGYSIQSREIDSVWR